MKINKINKYKKKMKIITINKYTKKNNKKK